MRKPSRTTPSRKVRASKKRKQAVKVPQAATKGRRTAAPDVPAPDPELVLYDRAIELFNAGRFDAAKQKFAALTKARNRELAHSADLRIRMCDQRLAAPDS